jgi:N-acetylglucosamine kinase-like BadF-type ATPase
LAVQTYVVGVDGGGTKTVALLATADGRILGRGESGSANYHNIGPHAAAQSIKRAVSNAKRNAGLERGKPEIAAVALAAIDSPRDRLVTNRFVRDAGIARRSIVVHDSVAALHAATQGGPGIIVISGTGSAAAGINKAGKYARAGGWGYVIDDEGSAYDIGRKALNKAFRAIDGRSPRTRLVSILARRFKVNLLENAQKRIYSDGLSVEEIAQLSPLVSRTASVDPVCREILADAGIKLGELVCAVARRLRMTNERFNVYAVGGNFRSGRYLLEPFEARIRKECSRARVVILKVEPAQGALGLALAELHRRHGQRKRA